MGLPSQLALPGGGTLRIYQPRYARPLLLSIPASKSDNVDAKATASASASNRPRILEQPRLVRLPQPIDEIEVIVSKHLIIRSEDGMVSRRGKSV